MDQLQDQEKVSQSLAGEAVLYRSLSENPKNDKWIIKSIKTNNSSIEFQQGLTVSPETEATPQAKEKKTQ